MASSTGWHRIVSNDRDGSLTGHFVNAGQRLLFSDSYRRGMSIWSTDWSNALGTAIGRRPTQRVIEMSPEDHEIYFAPGTVEAMNPADLAGFKMEPCERPPKDDVSLLVGDQQDWTDLWK